MFTSTSSTNLALRPTANLGLTSKTAAEARRPAMASLFHAADDVIPPDVRQRFPGREHQLRTLATLLHTEAAPCRNVVVHGSEATGKTAVTRAVVSAIAAKGGGGGVGHALVTAAQCVTGRHLFERIAGAVAAETHGDDDDDDAAGPRCETLAQLAVALDAALARPRAPARFLLVLDGVDRQRDAPPTLLPALARLSEIMPRLSCVFIVTAPPVGFLRTAASAHVHFPAYAKADFVRILALEPPPPPVAAASQPETADLWARFCAAVHDALVRSASRTLPSLRRSCRALWPRFVAPVVAGTLAARDFSRLLVAARAHFHDESLLNPSIVSAPPAAAAAPVAAELVGQLPVVARLLLLAAYLASHNATRHDLTLFSTRHHARKRRRGRGFVAGPASSRAAPRAKHRKIARKLLGAHAFVLERMLAVFDAVRGEWAPDGSAVGVAGLDGDVGMAIATLASLRLLVRVGSGDVTDRAGKWRINTSWEVVRGIGRSLGVEVEEWLLE